MLDPKVGDELLDHLAKYAYATREHIVFLLIWRGLLRRGGARAIDIRDIETEGEDPRIRIRHRPDTDTPLKNKFEANRQIGIKHSTTRQTLSRIHQDDDRRAWYLDATAADDRVEEALQDVHYEHDAA